MGEIYKAKEKVSEVAGKLKVNLSMDAIKNQIEKVGNDSLLSSYVTLPNKVCFETQDDDEQVVLFLRQHPIVNLKWMTIVAFMITIPSVFAIMVSIIANLPLY